MIFLEREKREFARTHKEFAAAYVDAVLELRRVYEERSAVRDVDTPLHHRKSPEECLGEMKSRCHRLNSLFAKGDLVENVDTLNRVIEECSDIANYSLFISALCSMLLKERAEAEVAAVVDEMVHKPWPTTKEMVEALVPVEDERPMTTEDITTAQEYLAGHREIRMDKDGNRWALLPPESTEESEYDRFSRRMEEPAP